MESNTDIPATERSGKRLKSELRVYYGPSKQIMLAGFSIDLGIGGLYLQTAFPLDIGSNLTLIFSLPDHEKSVSCKAKVAWDNSENQPPHKSELPSGVGLQFIDLHPGDLVLISKFIEKHELEAAW